MLERHAAMGQASLLVLFALAALAGCQSTGDRPTTPAPGATQTTTDARSTTPLADIEPRITKPICAVEPEPLSDRSLAQIEKAQSLIAEQRYTEAAIQLERALRYDPNHPRIQRTLAILHWQAGNVERARIHAQRAIESCAADAVAHYVSGRCLALDENRAGTITAYRTALASSDFADNLATAALCHYHLASELAREGYLEAALDQYGWFERRAAALGDDVPEGELAALLRSNHGSAATAKASMLDQLGRYGEAADALAPAVASSDDDRLLMLYGTLLAKAERFHEAIDAVKRISSNDEDLLALLDRIYTGLGDAGRMIDELHARRERAPEDAGLALHLARRLARAGRMGEAITLLESFLDTQPQADEIRSGLLDLLAQNRDWKRVLQVCGSAILEAPERAGVVENRIHLMAADPSASADLLDDDSNTVSAVGAYLRGILASATGQRSEARRWLERARDIDADFIPARVALARWHLDAHRHVEALAVAKRRDPDTSDAAALELVLGDIHERLDQTADAERHYRAAIQLRPDDTRAMLALATLYQQNDEVARARRQLRVLLDHEPNHDVARERLTFIHMSEGNLDLAVRELEELIQRTGDPHVRARCEAFIKQIREPDPVLFRTTLLAAIESHGSNASTWLRVADSYAPDDEAEAQHNAYAQALLVDPDNEEAAIGAVRSAARLLRFEEAAERMATSLVRRPNRHGWRLGYTERRFRPAVRHFGLIELYLIIHDFDAALELARQGEALADLDDSTRARYRFAVIESLHLADRDADALAQLHAWSAAEPDNRGLVLMLADELLRQSKVEEAVDILQDQHAADPQNRALLATLIGTLIEADRHDRAVQFALDLMADDPDNDAFVAQMALVIGEAGRVDDALELVRNRLLHTFDRQRFQNMTVALLAEAKRHDDAADYVESLLDAAVAAVRAVHEGQVEPAQAQEGLATIARYPNEPYTLDGLHERMLELRISLSGVLITGKDFAGALDLLSEWLEGTTGPGERIEYLRRVSFCHQGLGNEKDAQDALLKALALQPGNVTFNNDVAYAWIDRGERLDEAEAMIRYAVSRFPRQSAYLDTYGWLLYKKGSFAEAKRWLVRGNHGRDGADPVIRDHLGDTYWRLGDREAAIEQWQAAIEVMENRGEDATPSADERRVRQQTPLKIEAAGSNAPPPVAPLAPPPGANEAADKEE